MAKLALFLLGKKGLRVLKYIAECNLDIVAYVVGSRDSGVDRDYYEDIQGLCRDYGISHYERSNSRIPARRDGEFILAVGWRWMIPSNDSLIIIHDSLLPRYRGFSPLVNCLINGEDKVGATAILAANDYDAGNIIAQSARSICYPIKIKDAIDLMGNIYVELVSELIENICSDTPFLTSPQNDSEATYSLWRDDDDYWIDWDKSAKEIERFIDAVGSPYLGARCMVNNILAIIHSAEAISDVVISDRESSIGKVIFNDKSGPVVVCGDGLLKVKNMTTIRGEALIPLTKFRTRFTSKR